MKDDRFDYHRYLNAVVEEDVKYVKEKDVSYGASWKKRGGVGAFMMLARKWDRLEEMVKRHGSWGGGELDAPAWDIFSWIAAECRGAKDSHFMGRDGTVLAEVRDLRRYLLLLEAEILYRLEEKNGKTT